MTNVEWYDGWRAAPANALRRIAGGPLSGKTDINPMWRIRALTERFGPCGFGWYTETVEHWVESAAGETVAWTRVRLYVRDPESGEWSRPIEGVGGSKQSGKGRGDGANDECFKMSETDAISVCAKKLGMAADVYWQADATKYSPNPQAAASAASGPKPPLSEAVAAMEAAQTRLEMVAAYRKYKPWFDGDAEFDAAAKTCGARFPREGASS